MAKKDTKAKKPTEIESSDEQKQVKRTRIFLVVFAAVALVSLIVSIIVGVSLNRNKTVDYMKIRISKYVNVPENLYKGYEVTVSIPEITDDDVEKEITAILVSKKKGHTDPETGKELPVYNDTGVTIGLGDVVNLYYRGYTTEDGVKKYFDGGCNFGESLAELEIGTGSVTVGSDTGSFIEGFDTALIGKNQTGCATVTTIDNGKTQPADMIKLTYSATYADGTSAYSKTVTIDLSDPNLDERWGEGFGAYFNNESGIVIGEQFASKSNGALTVKTVKETEDGDGEDIYFDMKISQVYRISSEPKMEINVTFPEDYSAEELQGKDATFEIYVKTVKDYYVPEFNDEFITDTLKLKAEDLSSYNGEDLVAKYKSYVKAQLNEAREEQIRVAVEDGFWDKVIAGSTFKKLPKDDVNAMYQSSVEELQAEFNNSYTNSYSGNFSAFMRDYLGLGATDSWEDAVRKNAEDSVKQKLIFYYIVRKENLVPTDAEYQEIYDDIFAEYLQSYLDYYKITEESENYEASVEQGKKIVVATYGEDYFDELVRYEFAIKKIVSFATVIYK